MSYCRWAIVWCLYGTKRICIGRIVKGKSCKAGASGKFIIEIDFSIFHIEINNTYALKWKFNNLCHPMGRKAGLHPEDLAKTRNLLFLKLVILIEFVISSYHSKKTSRTIRHKPHIPPQQSRYSIKLQTEVSYTTDSWLCKFQFVPVCYFIWLLLFSEHKRLRYFLLQWNLDP